ncbi:FtsW/RodA/SpoVE family cell cycle protein [Anaerocolumna sedimenticola]|uniref:FtsW/RodA/SpoVE family cell cycle protein n=1 Tax=Anaerocolumna sedimenticola TaxID=2696063 RepID=A0A6P1TPW6_9FIRM|nr:FtsW/RodA/SpoVE family cell cycle protein [Anaerocolumna sedimenticola]QHQ62249.1 FtsW/RodA/SpoVE family cell cycle protein [Anaerocolumna sedimenticola]
MFQFKQYNIKHYDISMMFLVIILSGIGAYLVRLVETEGEGLFTKQILGIILGVFVLVVVSLIDYHFISQFYIILYIINLVLLVAVRIGGVTINSSKRWLQIGPIQFQPSELSKIITIIVLAKLFTIFRDKMNKFYVLLLTGILTAIPTFFILIQTNLSTSIVIMFVFVIMIFGAGLSYKIILPILIIGVPAILGLLWCIDQNYDIFFLTDYQQTRIESFLNPEADTSNATMYQQDNSIQVIGSGKLIGKLLTEGEESLQSDTYVPISESDFIFSVIGEALGFIGGCVIIVILSIIIFKCISIAYHAPDFIGMLIAIGVASMFMFQVFVNIGVATALLPNTGIPLPFVSYGLSSMISSMIAIGLVMNISLQRKNKRG